MPGKNDGLWSAFSLAGSIGLNMAAAVAVGLFLGRWADSYLNSFPWFTVSGIVLGMAAGLWGTYKRIVKNG
ncbi:AtpZ/AtpI family protein [Sporomusa malonica]|uniref:Putative F0F1-ATPase subunit Ca2+/Mg2+ transporter n=1 Tax=Sporomusa malonica TaxID=112901 RepID=A0A1W1YR63_9FIRM|nr:AtpZ/AtpI family protein [Sporomusa malonica]SMC38291.1 Putative F0F1-ATPase subunit Ca2+/Mg2+ transporter [Sporomusa malonica]